MSIDNFLCPRLTGSRFENHAVPLEFLKDLAVLEEMIKEVAKYEFIKENAGRKRSPRGFTEDVELKITGIEEGSAKLILSLVIAAVPTLFSPENQVYFERARDDVIKAIMAAGQDQGNVTDHLPEKSLSYFNRLGMSLREDESIEFTLPGSQNAAKLTRETRRRLVLMSSKVKELTDETYVRGTVPEVDQDNMTFEVQTIQGGKIKAPIDTQHLDAILDATKGYKDGVRVLLKGVGRFNRNGRLLRFDSVEHINVLDALDIAARLDELRILKDGWYEGRGKAPSKDGLDWLVQVFEQYYPEELPLPYLYPTEEGGIRAEWSHELYEMSLDINLETHKADWHSINIQTDQEDVQELNFNEVGNWEVIKDKIYAVYGEER